MHLVMRSKRARGPWSFLKFSHKARIHALLVDLCDRYGVKLYSYENVGNHLHLVVRIPDRRTLRKFLRVFAQGVMFVATGARKGSPKGRFFDRIAYTRIVDWAGDFDRLLRYMMKNALESLGFSPELVRHYYQHAKATPL